MIVVLGFCQKDQDLALRNARWWNELGGCKGHDLLVCYDPRCDPGVVEQIRVEMEKCFDKIWRMNDVSQVDGWPEGANYFFRLCCTWLQDKPQWPAFFWMEPDAIPLSPGWVDAIAAEYKRGGKPFMGDRVEVKINGEEVPLHMSGVGVYENPIFLHAGEAYRAHDVAWDMAAKDQIVPRAHFTDLIEHAWKHPTFHDLSELGTQIAPQTLLFHSSKDGSLIDLLAQKRGGKQIQPEGQTQASHSGLPTIKEPDEPGSPSPLIFSESVVMRDGKVEHAPVYDIFIRTYPGDYQWLEYCMQSIRKFCSGFRKIWIVSPASPTLAFPDAEWKVINDETEDGYLAQQITKLYADVLCDYQADYILHVDSDIVFTRPTTPQDFFWNGKLIWYYTPYHLIQTPWQPITEKFMMEASVPYEFMRRLPMMMPRWLYPRMREACHNMHGRIVSEYVRAQPPRAFSEFNALGAYAWMYHKNLFEWWHTIERPMPEPFAKQFHSWSGITPEVKHEIETILGGGVSPAPPSQIKKLSSGVWVLEGDQISEWVEQEGRLDHDQWLLPIILAYINEGDTVIDAGAHIGDHTIAYAKKVGPNGMVHAFEPNPAAFHCLAHNLEEYDEQFYPHPIALGNEKTTVPISGNNGQPSGAYVGEHMKVCDARMRKLDSFKLGPAFIKIDIEGCELKMLEGAAKTIETCQPTMVIEINRPALERQGATPDQIFGWLTQHCYGWRILEENTLRNDPQYNIIALPAVDKPDSAQAKAETPVPERIDASASALTPSPQVSFSGLKQYIRHLKAFSDMSMKHKAAVSQQLVYAKLRKPNKSKQAHRKRRAAAKERKA